jgi:Raf kinase inhibitor-like YbhB/YbcL family protein
MAFTIESPAFGAGQAIPREHTADGANRSPPLAWRDLPAGTQALTLIVEDPDAPGPIPFVHWLVYDLPTTVDELPAGASGALPGKAVEGKDSWGRARYEGPAPPAGRAHRYQFRLFALDHDLDLPAGLDRKALLAAMEGHALAEASLVGIYGRAT